MTKIYKLSFVLIVALCSIALHAQVKVEKSDNLIFVLGKKYYLHKVESGQTLYSICRVYEVTEADIFSENSVIAREGLKAGAEIKIPVKDPNEIEPVSSSNTLNTNSSSDEYIFHTVKKKQTLYFLTHTYNVSELELIELNPEITQGLKEGQVIKVPKPGTAKVTSSGDYRLHSVQPGETLFSLAQRYGVEISSLKLSNPELNEGGLRIGQVLRIPTRTRSFEEVLKVEHSQLSSNKYYDYDPLYFEEPGVTPCNSYSYNGASFKVAVLLPLYIQENATMKNSGKYYKNTERFYEFYQGLLLAAKKMKSLGVSVEFVVKDTKASSERVKEILSLSIMQDVDLIIGPVYSENFSLASSFAKQHKINIVAPFKLKHENLVVTNPYAFLANPSEETEVERISSFLSSSYDRSILIVHNGSLEELELIETYKKKLVQAFVPYEQINEIVFKQVNFKLGGAAAVENALSVGLHNIVIIPSNDQVFITNAITKLNYLTKNYKITLYGRSAWENFRNIEIEYLRNLKFHYGTTGFVDKNDKSVKNFDYSYKTYFNAAPSSYSYLGYDVSYFFLNALKDYGRHFQFCLPSVVNKNYTKGLCCDFQFKRVSPFSGFENNWLSIVKINEALELVKVN